MERNIKLSQEKNIDKKYQKGSVTLEAAIIMPFFICICIIFLYILQIFSAYERMNRAVVKTSEIMSAYASLYHTHGMEQAEDRLISLLKNSEKENNENSFLKKFINIKNLSKKGDDIIYSGLAEGLYDYFYETEEYFNGIISESVRTDFSGSEFFNDGENIILKVSAEVEPIIDIPFDIFPEIKICTIQKSRCWLYGKINSKVILSGNVWNMDNFSRGKYLRSVYGANLDEFYPVIAIFDGRKAIMIKSLDHTSKTYLSSSNLKKEICKMADQLSEFYGTDNEKFKDYTPKICENEIKEKVLLLVIPSNEISENQSKAFLEASAYCGMKGIKIQIETYGYSDKNMVK